MRTGRRPAALEPESDRDTELLEHIPGARYAELAGGDTLSFVGDTGAVVDAIEEGLTGQLRPPPAHRVYCKRIVTSQVNRAASPEVAVQGAGLNGLGA